MKKIPGHNGYFADKNGNIYSIWTNVGMTKKTPKIKNKVVGSNGYLYTDIRIRKNEFFRTGIHRLICMTFNGIPKKGDTASHLNGNKTDNRASNLVWESLSDNHKRKVKHGTDDRGYRNKRAKITEEQYKEILSLLKMKKMTHKEIGKNFNVNRVFITKINCGYRYNMNKN
jgi:hypothetical protein